jgi:hypothetical protein
LEAGKGRVLSPDTFVGGGTSTYLGVLDAPFSSAVIVFFLKPTLVMSRPATAARRMPVSMSV